MLSCLFVITLGQFIPIYFIDIDLRQQFYICVFCILFITTALTTFAFVYKPYKSKILVWSTSIVVSVGTFVLLGFWLILLLIAVWTEAGTYYVNKDNPKIKIISRYLNEGAFGGGTEPDDYEVVLQKPLYNLFNIQTKIDTNSIDKRKWIKYK